MKTNFNRRRFIKTGAIIGAGLTFIPPILKGGNSSWSGNPVRLGGPVPGNFTDPAEWMKAVKSLGYSAAYCPVQPGASGELIKSFRAEAKKSNILIAEVGAWNNTLDPNDSARKDAVEKNIAALKLADEIGASCCVNISGARGEIWDGPYIKSIHAKDIIILPELTVHLEERRPGSGTLDYSVFLQEASKLRDIPFMLEHLETQNDYKLAADYVREMGKKAGVLFPE